MYSLTSLSEVIWEFNCDTKLETRVNISDSTITLLGSESTKRESSSSGKTYPSNSGLILIELGKILDSLFFISRLRFINDLSELETYPSISIPRFYWKCPEMPVGQRLLAARLVKLFAWLYV